jgi:hypothetical protein
MPPTSLAPSRLIVPGEKKIVTAASKLEEEQQRLYEAAQVMKGAHIHALAEKYLEETGFKAEETCLIEQRSPDGLAARYFFVKKPSPQPPVAPPPGNDSPAPEALKVGES